MSIFAYICPSCQNAFDVQHGLNESPETCCPKCGGQAEKDFCGTFQKVEKMPGKTVRDFIEETRKEMQEDRKKMGRRDL
jgi:putative FmdB family regulatory protein